MAERKVCPAIVIRSEGNESGGSGEAAIAMDPAALEERLSALLDEFSPVAVQDLRDLPLPPGGLWDPAASSLVDPPLSAVQWRVFFSSPDDRAAAAHAVKAAHPDLTVESEDVPDDDWAARSQRQVTAITAGAFIVAPPWDIPATVAAGTSVIVIEPSRGFGTGHHASTRLCLRALSDTAVGGARVLDLGTGSGVLAMGAMLKGAHQVVAVDIDPDAIDAARQSARLNARVATIAWLVGDFRDRGWDVLTGGPFDVVLANLTGGMLTSAATRIRELIKKGGVLIASGFNEGERARVEEALALRTRTAMIEDGWVGLVLGA